MTRGLEGQEVRVCRSWPRYLQLTAWALAWEQQHFGTSQKDRLLGPTLNQENQNLSLNKNLL